MEIEPVHILHLDVKVYSISGREEKTLWRENIREIVKVRIDYVTVYSTGSVVGTGNTDIEKNHILIAFRIIKDTLIDVISIATKSILGRRIYTVGVSVNRTVRKRTNLDFYDISAWIGLIYPVGTNSDILSSIDKREI